MANTKRTPKGCHDINQGCQPLDRVSTPGHTPHATMKTQVLIETHTMPAYRAIRPAIVAAKVGYIGVSGLTISATIFMKDFAYLVDVVNHAAQSAGVDRAEYEIKTMHKLSNPSKH